MGGAYRTGWATGVHSAEMDRPAATSAPQTPTTPTTVTGPSGPSATAGHTMMITACSWKGAPVPTDQLASDPRDRQPRSHFLHWLADCRPCGPRSKNKPMLDRLAGVRPAAMSPGNYRHPPHAVGSCAAGPSRNSARSISRGRPGEERSATRATVSATQLPQPAPRPAPPAPVRGPRPHLPDSAAGGSPGPARQWRRRSPRPDRRGRRRAPRATDRRAVLSLVRACRAGDGAQASGRRAATPSRHRPDLRRAAASAPSTGTRSAGAGTRISRCWPRPGSRRPCRRRRPSASR
jgi:hypothetical protein